jgi:mannitol/fructose-specific phosphotransferase system IIA component (Ntr-type)
VIAELLQPAKIIFGLKGEFSQVIDTLCKRSAISNLPEQLRNKKINRDEEGFSYISDGIAMPHLRVDNLPAPELILGEEKDRLYRTYSDFKVED